MEIWMSYCDKIIAKSNKQALTEHTEQCIYNYNILKDKIDNIIDNGIKNINVNPEIFWENSFISVLFHDYGKHDLSFQEKMNEDINKKALPHALISAIKLYYNYNNPIFNINMASLCALSHHSMLGSNLFKKNSNLSNLNLCDDTDFIKFTENKINSVLNKKIYFNKNVEPKDYNSFIIKNIHHSIENLNKNDREQLRIIYALMENILHFCDWSSSSGNKINFFINYGNKIYEYLKSKENFKGLNALQEYTKTVKGSTIIESTTGSGKTEASLLWAKNNSNKIFYILPTMNTSNEVYFRLKKIFNSVGILHSTSDLIMDPSDPGKNDDFSKLYSKTFFMPVMVSTVDQILYSLYNINRWDSILFNSYISGIIFDEIHAYDYRTTSHIVKFISEISKFNSNILIMSATIPESLIDFIKQKSGVKFSYKKFDFVHKYKSKITVMGENILLCISKLKELIKSFDKILIIVNTIGTAKKIFQMAQDGINGIEIVLFHSQFIYKDRQDKMSEISNSKKIIAVCTQIAEVSLDIDYDALITESAPPDSLIQRFGRVNRYGKKENAQIYIYKWEENSEYIYDKKYVEASYNFFKNYKYISNKEAKDIINYTYNDDYRDALEKKYNEVESYLNDIRNKVKSVYKLNISELIADRHNLIRCSDYPKILAIPSKYYNDIYNEFQKSYYDGWRKYLSYSVNIPYTYKTKAHIKNFNDNNNMYYFDFDYNSSCGVNYEKINIDGNII